MRLMLSAAVAAALLAAAPAAAQGQGRPDDNGQSPAQLAIDGLDRLMRALQGLVEQIPQYEAPQMNENGDIIIRRKPSPPQRPAAPADDPDRTET